MHTARDAPPFVRVDVYNACTRVVSQAKITARREFASPEICGPFSVYQSCFHPNAPLKVAL